jgi:cytochrome c-type biogenesis protein
VNPAEFIQRLSASVEQNLLIAMLVATVGGGLSTSVCPCTLPTAIGLVGYVGGAASDAAASSAALSPRVVRRGLLSLMFFTGLVLSLTAVGTAAAMAGKVFRRNAPAFSVIAGLVLGVVGSATLAGPWVRRRLPDPVVRQRGGLAGAFGYGIAYSVATITSSAGPLLLLLTVAAAIGRPWYAVALSTAFAVGRGLPFFAIGYGAEVGGSLLQPWLARLDRGRRSFELASGVALLALAGYFLWLATVLSPTL